MLPVDTKNATNGTAPVTRPNWDRYPRPTLLGRIREKTQAAGVLAVGTVDDSLLAGVDHVPRWALHFGNTTPFLVSSAATGGGEVAGMVHMSISGDTIAK